MEGNFCKACGVSINSNGKNGYCRKHYQQFMKYGELKDHNQRTVWDPNEVRVFDDYAEIGITEMCFVIYLNRTDEGFTISGGTGFLDDLLLAYNYALTKGIHIDTIRIMGTTTNTPVLNSNQKTSYLSIIDTILEKFSDEHYPGGYNLKINFNHFNECLKIILKNKNEKALIIDSGQYRHLKNYDLLKGKLIIIRTSVTESINRACIRFLKTHNNPTEKDIELHKIKKYTAYELYKKFNTLIIKSFILYKL